MWTIQTDCRNPLSPIMRGSTASACNFPLPTLIRACRDLRGRSGFALPSSLVRAHSCVPLFRKCSLAPPQRPIAPSRPLFPQPRIGATLRRAPLRGRALPPLPARPSLPPRPAANQRPAHRHRSLSEHNQPPPPSRIANGQRSQPSTRPGFRTSHRPPLPPPMPCPTRCRRDGRRGRRSWPADAPSA